MAVARQAWAYCDVKVPTQCCAQATSEKLDQVQKDVREHVEKLAQNDLEIQNDIQELQTKLRGGGSAVRGWAIRPCW